MVGRTNTPVGMIPRLVACYLGGSLAFGGSLATATVLATSEQFVAWAPLVAIVSLAVLGLAACLIFFQLRPLARIEA